MDIKDISKLINESIVLRKPNEHKIKEYAERMAAGVDFPPIVIGSWPKTEKYGDSGIVDGLHRLSAAAEAKITDLKVEHKKFPAISDALAYMYTANMAHGLPVTEGQRNSRIKLVKMMDPHQTIDTLAKTFSLHRSSIDRILKDSQGEGRSGPKGGATKSKGQKSQDVLKPKAFFSVLERIDYTCNRVRAVKDIIEFAMPMAEDKPVLDKDKLDLIKKVQRHLSDAVKELS